MSTRLLPLCLLLIATGRAEEEDGHLTAALATAVESQVAKSSPIYLDSCSEDSIALLQQDVRAHRRKSATASGRLSILANLSQGHGQSPAPAFDCTAYPELCKAPFNCDQPLPPTETFLDIAQGIGSRGVNLRSWCLSPSYAPYVSQCIGAGDLDGAAKTQFEMTTAGAFGEFTNELDGSYCFIEGHCTNTAVTNATTLEEATRMCDERYGHGAWAHAGSLPETLATATATLDEKNGFASSDQTRHFVLLACAMGNYHCDVRYCHETYCKDEYYIRKYGHFLKDNGWVQ